MRLRFRNSNTVKILIAAALWACLPQCQSQVRDSSTRASKGSGVQEKFLEVVSRSDIQGLFKSSSDFVSEGILEGVRSGRTSCKTITSKGSLVASGILPWPPDLKEYLTDLLVELPSDGRSPSQGLKARAVNSIDSIFLVTKEVLALGSQGAAAGLACDLGTNLKGVLFLNEATFVTDRLEQGLRSRQSFELIPSPHLVIRSADNAAVTFLHEIFHAVDNKYFRGTENAAEYDLRTEIRALSWRSGGEPRYPIVNGLDLTGGVERAGDALDGENPGCRPLRIVSLNLQGGLDLVKESPEDVSERLLHLESETNFIVPYTQENSSEDFAESLAVYYFGHYNNRDGRRFGQYGWQKRDVYADDLTRTKVRASKILKSYDTRAILSNYPLQRTKICKMAALVFKEKEETCLEDLANGI